MSTKKNVEVLVRCHGARSIMLLQRMAVFKPVHVGKTWYFNLIGQVESLAVLEGGFCFLFFKFLDGDWQEEF